MLSFRLRRSGFARPMESSVLWSEWPLPRQPWLVRRALASMVDFGMRLLWGGATHEAAVVLEKFGYRGVEK